MPMTGDLPVGTVFVWATTEFEEWGVVFAVVDERTLRVVIQMGEDHEDEGQTFQGNWLLPSTYRVLNPCPCPRHGDNPTVHIEQVRRQIRGQV